MRATTDTIAAIATPRGRGGIGIVRIAGADLSALIAGLVGKPPAPRVATLATFRDAGGAALDQGIALYFPAPHSYTGDDVLEVHGHGGRAVQEALLARCVELGARLAAPGEFTQRAYLNDRMDLAQAESVADLIDAATSTAARAAARSLTGEFSRAIDAVRDGLVELRMFVEATLDFPEDDVDFVRAHDAGGRLASIRTRLATLLARARTGALLRDGLSVVLIGRPNVGKSSLLNRLVREDAAIVTPLPGTTRDTVQRQIEIAGIPLTVVDTAGLRDTEDPVESVGIDRAWQAVRTADLALVLVDARDAGDALAPEDAAIVARLDAALPRVVVHNKADLAGIAPSASERGGVRHVVLSALSGDGVALLEREVLAIAGASTETDDTFLARDRHLAALRDADTHLERAAGQLAQAAPPLELFAEELRMAHDALATITGAFTPDDLIGVIFARFCIGK
ncbi:MAG TPA: tRNA uridine-5-carboxymethylaminomethyl(34) synthesis GTPase MnmE [Casimicrobiaceae bacterium]|jgi:tRNA modification GTPase